MNNILNNDVNEIKEDTHCDSVLPAPLASGEEEKAANNAGAESAQDVVENPDKKQDKDRKDLEKFERKILSYQKLGRTIGEVLKEIRDRKLYKLKGYKTFQRYCKEKFDITPTHAYRMIAHHDICILLEVPACDVPEKTTRALSNLRQASEEEKKQLWKNALEASSDQYPTTDEIQEVVKAFKEAHKTQPDASADTVYVKGLGKRFPVSDLAESLIKETQTAVALLQVCPEVRKHLSEDAWAHLKVECMSRIQSEFENAE